MKHTPQFEGLYNYRTWEDKIISIICARYWRPKRIGGSSIAKADVVIRTYFRIQLLCMLTFFTGLAGITNSRFDLKIIIYYFVETFYHGEPYRLLAIVGPISTTMAIFIFCRTDSERSTAYFSLFVVYSALYLSVMQRTAFDIFTLHYTSYLILGGLILGMILCLSLPNLIRSHKQESKEYY